MSNSNIGAFFLIFVSLLSCASGFLLTASSSSSSSFLTVNPSAISNERTTMSMSQGKSTNENDEYMNNLFPSYVIGYRGGVAEEITRSLASLSEEKKVSAIFDSGKSRSDKVPGQGANVDVKYEDLYNFNTAPLSNKVISGDVKSIFISLDNPANTNGDNEEALHDYRPLNDLLSNFIQTANNNPQFYKEIQNIPIVISAYGNDTMMNGPNSGGFFNSLLSGGTASPKEILNAFQNVFNSGDNNNKKNHAILAQHGRLIGSLTGEEPVPFVSAPLGEPVVDEAWLRQASLMSIGGGLSRGGYKEKTSQRKTVAKAMVLAAKRILEGQKTGNNDIIKNFSVINLQGPPNSGEEIEKMVENLDVSRGIQLLELDMRGKGFEIPTNRQSFIEYFTDDWGPTALSSLKVAKRLDSAKPTRVYEASAGNNQKESGVDVIEIAWEQLVGDMDFEVIGKWRLQLDQSSLKVFRVKADNSVREEALPGEQDLSQKLVQGMANLSFASKQSESI